MKSVVYDAGVLISADNNERAVWAEHRVRLEAGVRPAVPAPVVAQVRRSATQVQLSRFVRGCEVVSFDHDRADRAGALLAKSKTVDVVDAAVVELATSRKCDVVTSDPKDIGKLIAAAASPIAIHPLRR